MNDSNALAKLVPGFDFLQGLMQSAGQAVPGMGQWIAPTLDPDEIDKRISELKTVQFWLEQNSRMLSTTVQALEVQKMTLSTLQTMNLPMAELQKALTLPTLPTLPTKPAAPARPAVEAKPAPPQESPGKPAVDPMQWWGALTQQFTELAAKAVQDSTAMAARAVAPVATAGGGAKPAAAAKAPAAPAAKRPAAAKKAVQKKDA